MQQSLFPQNAPRAQAKPFIQFKAGRCRLDRQANGTSFLVTPEPQKGMASLIRANDGLTHFQWTNRTTNVVEENLILLPDDATFSKVNTGIAKDRVYVLQWRGLGARQVMLWMQDKSSEKDVENCEKFNEYMVNPPSAAGAPAGAAGDAIARLFGRGPAAPAAAARPAAAATPASIGGFDFSQMLQGAMVQQMGGPATPAPNAVSATPGTAVGSGALTAQDFQNAMMGFNPSAQRQPGTDLQEVLRGDQVVNSGILNDPEVINELVPLLPEGQQTPAHLEQSVRSPQFQQSVEDLAHAIEADVSGEVIANFGMQVPSSGVNLRDPVGGFLDAVQASAGGSSNESKDEETKDDSKMDESS